MAENATPKTVAEAKGNSEAEKLEKFKAQKKEAAQRFKERKAQEKKDRIEGAKKLIAELKKAGTFDKLSKEAQDFINGLANPAALIGGSNTSVFNDIFGVNPSVGAKVTLKEVFEKTAQGMAYVNKYIKKWAEQGIVVTFQKNDDILASTYTLEKLGK